MKKKKITLSVITPTLNNEKMVKNLINSVKRQNKSNFKLEIVVADGGSKDKTVQVAKQMGARVVANPYVFADPGVSVGMKASKGDILIVLAVDNIFEDKHALQKIVSVFDDKNVIAAFPMHFSSKSDSIYTKYINRFTDPFNHFVYGYAANGITFKRIYKTLESNKIYDVYDFLSSKNKPMIAFAQGFTLRKGFRRNKKNDFDDISPVMEILNTKQKIAFVHSAKLYHHTVSGLGNFFKKQAWASVNAWQKKKYGIAHRIEYLSEAQKFRTKIWPIYALSFILPLGRSIYGLVREQEPLWIFHPFLCMISACASIWGIIAVQFSNEKKFNRQ